MLISKEYNFIFIHIYKVAGTSISACLSEYDDRNFILRILNSHYIRRIPVLRNLNPYPFHIKAKDLRNHLGPKSYDKFFTFTFVRNPWDWTVSDYHYIKQIPSHHKHSVIKGLTFEEYIKYLEKRHKTSIPTQQRDFVSDGEEIIVDFIGKFENLHADFEKICDKIGIKNKKLRHENKSNRGSYRDYYTAETAKIIETLYHTDIVEFNYKFE